MFTDYHQCARSCLLCVQCTRPSECYIYTVMYSVSGSKDNDKIFTRPDVSPMYASIPTTMTDCDTRWIEVVCGYMVCTYV